MLVLGWTGSELASPYNFRAPTNDRRRGTPGNLGPPNRVSPHSMSESVTMACGPRRALAANGRCRRGQRPWLLRPFRYHRLSKDREVRLVFEDLVTVAGGKQARKVRF
jgi:hypothetical protein